FGCERRHWNRAPVPRHVQQSWRRWRIGVPQIVVNGLEMPLVGAGLNIDCYNRAAEEVRALAVAAVVAERRRRKRQIDDAALFIEREIKRPGVYAGSPFPAVAFPCVMANRARLRYGVELPQLGAGARIERARVSRSGGGGRRCVGADNDDVLVNERN